MSDLNEFIISGEKTCDLKGGDGEDYESKMIQFQETHNAEFVSGLYRGLKKLKEQRDLLLLRLDPSADRESYNVKVMNEINNTESL